MDETTASDQPRSAESAPGEPQKTFTFRFDDEAKRALSSIQGDGMKPIASLDLDSLRERMAGDREFALEAVADPSKVFGSAAQPLPAIQAAHPVRVVVSAPKQDAPIVHDLRKAIPDTWTEILELLPTSQLLDALKSTFGGKLGPLNELELLRDARGRANGIRWRPKRALPKARQFEVTPAINEVRLTLATAGITLAMTVEGRFPGDAFGINASIAVSPRLSIVPRPLRLPQLVLTIPTNLVKECDVWVNGWVYGLGLFSPHILALAIAADAAAGGVIASSINAAVRELLGPQIELSL